MLVILLCVALSACATAMAPALAGPPTDAGRIAKALECPDKTVKRGGAPPATDQVYCARVAADGVETRHGPEVGFHPNGAVYWRQTNVDGKAHGLHEMFFDTGAREWKGAMRHGEQHGEWTGWFPSGERQSVQRYDKGVRDGLSQNFYKSGQVAETMPYKSGQQHGEWKILCRDGSLWSYQRFDEGALVESRMPPPNAIPCEKGSLPTPAPAPPPEPPKGPPSSD